MSLITVTISRGMRVFLLEDSDDRIAWFRSKIDNLTIAKTAEEAIQIFATSPPFDFVFLDHDLGLVDYAGNAGSEGNGQQVAKHLAGLGFIGENILIHSWNPYGAGLMAGVLPKATVAAYKTFDIVSS